MTVTVEQTALAFRVEPAPLLKALKGVVKALPSARHHSPILGNVRVKSHGDNHITISATDLERVFTFIVPAVIYQEVDVVLSGKLLLDMVAHGATLKKPILFTVSDTNATVSVVDGGTYTLPVTFTVDEYPTPGPQRWIADKPLDLTDSRTGMTYADLVRYSKVAIAASKDNLIPALCSIQIEVSPDDAGMSWAATDRYRLAVATGDHKSYGTPWSVLVPAPTITTIVTLLKGTKSTVRFDVEDGWLVIETDDARFTVCLVEATFPQWRQLIPESDSVFTLDTKSMLNAIKFVSVVADRNAPFRFDALTRQVQAGSGDEPQAVSPVTITEVTGTFSNQIAFNPNYFVAGLGCFGEQVNFQVTKSDRPIVLVAPNDDTFRYLLMPVRMT